MLITYPRMQAVQVVAFANGLAAGRQCTGNVTQGGKPQSVSSDRTYAVCLGNVSSEMLVIEDFKTIRSHA
jgi:hypothetical protein